ncbi:restriction endonuclease subunit S [Mangrovimonas spongiae]|uniref:Restriction endonuclease subunit S n=1 Tax=Mangrovimonas spongiae TaxID=2494697 RepID=A0A428K1W6_9FLAO|nr:restriction endonuclease subunit S [Mangrovimonas spongiae]RSK40411.1 restriction endonuclease subunit S [Mangrovimonas spongiae]
MSSANDKPNGWEETNLGEVCEITSAKRIFAKEYKTFGIPFFRGKEVTEKFNGNEVSTELFITKEKYEEIKEKYGVPVYKDILLTSVGTLGNPYIVEKDFKFYFKDGNLTWFKNFNEISSKFLFYWLISPQGKENLSHARIGSTQQAYTMTALKRVEIVKPPLPEQKAIANILTAFDDKIENLQAQNKTLEQTAQTIFKEWFGKYQVGDELPDGWRVGELDEVIEFINGYAFKSKDLLKEEEPNCFKVFKMGDIKKGGGFNHDKTKNYFPKKGSDKLEKYILKNGDLLMSMTDMKDAISLLGHTALMIYDNEYIVNQRVGLIRANNDINIDYPFLYLLTNDKHFIANLRGRANSGVQVNLSTQAIKESLFKIPDKETNKKFDDLVKPLFEKRKHNYIAIQSLKKTRDTLLPKLMSGQIRVNEFKS